MRWVGVVGEKSAVRFWPSFVDMLTALQGCGSILLGVDVLF